MRDGLCQHCDASATLPSPQGTNSSRSWTTIVFPIAGAILLLYFSCVGLAYIVITWANQRNGAQPTVAPHEGLIARIEQLNGRGRIYLVQVGPHDARYALEDFAAWLRSKYSLDVQVLQPMVLDRSAWDFWRRQYVAECLYEQVKREHPELAADPNAYLIAFTDADMYSIDHNWRFSFTQRDMQRAAVISTARMGDTFWERIGEDNNIVGENLRARLRRILLKDVAVLYWHLPLNNDPTSVLHQTLDPDLPADEIYESDLDPDHTRWGRFEGEPCIFFGYSAKNGIAPLPGALIRTCSETSNSVQDESMELFEIDLRLGLLIDKHTDFYLPDTIPIQFRRVTRDGWKRPMGFGLSGTQNYDKFLWSADMRRIAVVGEDGGRDELDRVPAWLPILGFVKFVDADYSGKLLELRWHTDPFEHFELKRFSGDVESYLPCDNSDYCYLIDYRNARGEELVLERDNRRRLIRLASPNKNWLRLSYGTADGVTEINDSRGRNLLYSYDEHGQLTKVTYPSGEVLRYEYDPTQHLLRFSAALDAETTSRPMLRNEFENGKVVKQTLADGGTYTYSYYSHDPKSIDSVIVRTPDDRIFDIDLSDGCSSVRERPILPKSQESPLASQ